MSGGNGYHGVAANARHGKELSVMDSRLLEVSVTYTLKVARDGTGRGGDSKV